MTSEKFIPDPFSTDNARLYRTGDLARYLPDGNVQCLGRIDHQVKIRGFRIELGEVEAALSKYSAIRGTAVIAREEVLGDKRLIAYIVVDPGQKQNLSLTHLRSFLLEKLPDYMVPSIFVVVNALPLTPNGKVDRRALPVPETANILSDRVFIAPRTLLEARLVEIWLQILSLEQIGIDCNFFEVGGNSLLTAQLLSRIKETFGVELSLSTLFESPTVAELAQKVAAAQTGAVKEFDTVSVEVLKADAVLDSSIYPATSYLELGQEPQHILLTGATGFLGAFLLQELLLKTQATIYCLVRSSNLEKAKQKLDSNLKQFLIANQQFNHRIVLLLGDLSKPLLGMPEQKFRELAVKIDVIYHNGAYVNLVYPYKALHAANVLGTQEILRLASQVRVKPVHFISTLDVFQSPHYAGMPLILEQDEVICEGLADGYAQSKWVGEKLVMSAHSRGIPACIYRPGMITGHSQTGASQTNDLICRLIKGIIQLGSAPLLDIKISLTPVDYVSQAIVHLSQQSASLGKAFHLVSPHTVSFYQFIEGIRACGYAIEWTSYKAWQEQLLKTASSEVENALSPLLFLFTEWASENYLETTALVARPFDCQQTLAGLASTAITCSPINAKLLRAYASYFIRSGFLEASSSLMHSNYAETLVC